MHAFICIAGGTQYAPGEAAPPRCTICEEYSPIGCGRPMR